MNTGIEGYMAVIVGCVEDLVDSATDEEKARALLAYFDEARERISKRLQEGYQNGSSE